MTDPVTRLNAALEGRYRIERQLGEGGMATVYLADDLKHERKVALKVLKPELAAVVGAERFLAEIKTTANLQHPHILPLFDSGEADSFLFYVMPYVEGESLRERLDREHQLPVDEAVQIAKNVAEALDYAHRQGVIHRDIKPANILLQDGKPVVSDFGIALAIGEAGRGRLTETGLSLGTPHYMSPEQATGDLSIGSATDIYALGCVLYEMLVGEPPYTGSTPQAVLGKIVTGDTPSPTAQRRTVPKNVDSAVRKALERVPADRFASARDFAAAVDDPDFDHGEQVGSRVMAEARAWKGLAAGLMLFLMAGLGWFLLRSSPTQPVYRFDVGLGPGVTRLASVDNVSLAMSPDGSAIAYAGISSDGVTQLWVRELTDRIARPIPGTEGASYPTFSPDGESIAIRKDGDLVIVALNGAPPQTILPDVGVGDIAWGADGLMYIAFDGVYRMPPTLGEPEPLCVEEGVDLDWPDPLPNGRGVLVNHGTENDSGDQSVALVRLETCETEVLFPEGAMAKYAPPGHILYTTETGILMAAPFDLDRLEVTGRSIPVEEGISVDRGLASQFAVSSRGDLVYHPTGLSPGRSLVMVDREGREQELGLDQEDYEYPRLSPDGARLAVAIHAGQDVDLWVFDLDRRSPSRLTFGGDNRYYPVWTPNGERVTYSNGNHDGNTIYSVAADGTGGPVIVLESDGREFPTSWSGDGRVLAMHVNSSGTGRDIWTLRPGSDPEPFLVTPAAEQAPALSPDGRWLAYVSWETEQSEVYVQPYPGPGRKYTISTDGGQEPVWSPDGSELFYRSRIQMMVVPVDPVGADLRPGTPQPLFEDYYVPGTFTVGTPNYDVAPDGQGFVMVSAGTDEGAPFVYIQNFAEELRQRAPR